MKDDCEVTKDGVCETRGLICKVFEIVKNETGETVPNEAYTAFLTKVQTTQPKTQVKRGMMGYTNKDGKRYICRISRYLGIHLGLAGNVSEAFICKMADILNAEAGRGFTIKVHRGEAVERLYYQGFGSNSCMTGSGHSEQIRFYSGNPDKIGLITAECGTQQARALLWTMDNGGYYMDRIYHNTGAAYGALKNHAEKNEWPSYLTPTSELTNEEREFLSVSDLEDCDDHPYFDSMTQIYRHRDFHGIVAAVHFSANGKCKDRLRVNNYRISGRYRCSCCNWETNCEDDLFYIEAAGGVVCQACLDEHYSSCEICEVYLQNEDVYEIYLNGNDRYVCRWCSENFFQCDCPTHDRGDCQDYWRNSDDLNSLEDGRLYCDDCYEQYCEEQEEQEQEQKSLLESEAEHE